MGLDFSKVSSPRLRAAIEQQLAKKKRKPAPVKTVSVNRQAAVERFANGAVKIGVKPLSVNRAWQGQRFKSKEYKQFIRTCEATLPKFVDVPAGFLEVYYEFGLSNFAGDWDNPIKPFQDIISEKYGFNDNKIIKGIVVKVRVTKGNEYVLFRLCPASGE